MIAGHYAMALVPYELTRKSNKTTFWIFLLASQFLDFIMLIFVDLGIEALKPEKLMDLAFQTSSAEMTVSHDIIPALIWSIVVGTLVWLATRESVIALWCAALVSIHEIFDLFVGFTHNVHGSGTQALGLGLYNSDPVFGFLIEAILCFSIVSWFCWHRSATGTPCSPKLKWSLYVILVGASVAQLPIATQSLNVWLNV